MATTKRLKSDILTGMAEVFTIAGPPVDSVEVLGAPTVHEMECAQEVKVPFLLGAGIEIAAVPTALFGGYKLLKKRPAAGVTALIASGLLYFIGMSVVRRAAEQFESCRNG